MHFEPHGELFWPHASTSRSIKGRTVQFTRDDDVHNLSPSLQMLAARSQDGCPGRFTLRARPTGSYGVALVRAAYSDQIALQGASENHLIGFIDSGPVLTHHMMAGERRWHQSGPESLCIAPAGVDYNVEFFGPVEGLTLEISRECLAIAQAEAGAYKQILMPDMDSADSSIRRIATAMEREVNDGYANGVLYWSSLVDALIRHLVIHHTCDAVQTRVSVFDSRILRRIDDFINANLAEPFDLDDLATIAECDKFRFARTFARCTGLSPHRFVVRRRIERARALIIEGRQSLAEIATTTGFSDQSHLNHWMKRIWGFTPGRLVQCLGRKNLQDGLTGDIASSARSAPSR